MIFDLNCQFTGRRQDQSLRCVVEADRFLLGQLGRRLLALFRHHLVGHVRVDETRQNWQAERQSLSAALNDKTNAHTVFEMSLHATSRVLTVCAVPIMFDRVLMASGRTAFWMGVGS